MGARLIETILDEAQRLPGPLEHRRQDPAVHRRLAAEDAQRQQARVTLRQLAGVDRDPVVKYDGAGRPVRLSETGLNRSDRHRLARELRRGA